MKLIRQEGGGDVVTMLFSCAQMGRLVQQQTLKPGIADYGTSPLFVSQQYKKPLVRIDSCQSSSACYIFYDCSFLTEFRAAASIAPD